MVGTELPGIPVGAYMYSASLPGTGKSLWEHYNELTAELDATQAKMWHNMADTMLLFVRAHSLETFPVAKVQVGRYLCGRPFNLYRLRPPTVKA